LPSRLAASLLLLSALTACIFRSIDEARSRVRINDDQHEWGLILQIAGDPPVYGRVYVGTHGRGVLYGEPSPRVSRHNSRQP
jgi:hypothetical protein